MMYVVLFPDIIETYKQFSSIIIFVVKTANFGHIQNISWEKCFKCSEIRYNNIKGNGPFS